jgi:ubiquitin-protein ligase
MISFACPTCGRTFCLPPSAAGRKGTCKCGALMVVPQQQTAAPAAPAAPASTVAKPAAAKLPPMRTRRLIADAAQMKTAFHQSRIIRIRSATGSPPELYQIEYRVRGLHPGDVSSDPMDRDTHLVEIQLTSEYPHRGPKCRMLTPVFHPNIDESSGTICIGDHWVAGERLVDLVVRIGEMIAYQAYNIQSPLNGEAAMWADLNPERLPIDTRNLHPAV